ncbi:Crp/Fnr family transcriptional regulator [Martelella endophytica]|uniref:Crp/Fnr family transcriptional regulator n=1 Tax=Martelella endophytica TaxID=1486262 RepID=A0A0D5LUH3_MAREN|nr:Crp/Fnr family transcriptional regulator [Martelella endophytica]AJY47721.1 Crp/Fnr family transcriptional regulator [Martelella endophytica]
MNRTLLLNERKKTLFVETRLTSSMDMATMNRLMECATFANCYPRDVVFRQGDPATHFYSVLSGYVRLYRQNSEGREADIRVCGPGESFADDLVFGGDTYEYHAQAADKAMLARYDLSKVRHVANSDGGLLARAIAGSLSGQLQETMDCIANDRLNTAVQRVALYLLEQCEGQESSGSFRLAFQKSLLAGKLGLAPEALSRAFATLKELGVQVHGRIIEIEDMDALRRL